MAPLTTSTIADVYDGLSPMAVHALHRRAEEVIQHGQGAAPPRSFNNQGFLALFAIIGGGMVIAAIWFFFWAKNGGFKFQEGDWEEYKSTVLRRKGPDGRTLSNATKSTKLGGGSVVHGGGDYGQSEYTESSGYTEKSEMREPDRGHGIRGGGGQHSSRYSNRKPRDPELAEYRHEKPARVGGLNRQNDGVHFDYSNTGSDLSQTPLVKGKDKDSSKTRAQKEKERKANAKAAQKHLKAAQKEAAAQEKKAKAEAKAAEKRQAQKKKDAAKDKDNKPPKPSSSGQASSSKPRAPPTEYTYDDTATVYTSPYTDYVPPSQPSSTSQGSQPSQRSQPSSYYDSYRPHNTTRSTNTPPRTHSQSPRKPRRVFSERDWATGVSSDSGTKAYPHYIPGLSSAGSVAVEDSVSQAGARRERDRRGGGNGYRRGGGRRDSLDGDD
ncbi:hypothetical protein EJ05DRAFT_475347 [Pseudovirgaria hyperparasitica]|uniref:Uncharacterized protein n=1 Tax=Pseudovirgaria hyperparasitica TaxID=470096 RepID=A0A6A6W8A6_9PEZI|nr:uncharacterized protein EJ05DRAFT_475347 [Pseudovirgaria hyperparasitica]KAF2759118.1 hypothetical protein EJ05DRAFT_475347 [Pseudovirgaria hyperparasitica]